MNLIVGLGKTGLSLAQYLQRKHIPFDILEENTTCTNFTKIANANILHHITETQLHHYETIYLSPGVNPHLPLYTLVKHKLSNDLNLFTRVVKKPYIAITGSNGKSTLVYLLEAALRGAGYKAIAIGNNGMPMLDHVEDDVDYFILELSSYQLELARPFLCEVAYVSNISEDHLDRHGTLENYAMIKETVYQNCRYAVVNEADNFCKKMTVNAQKISNITSFPLPLKMIGQHNIHHAFAVMAIIDLLNVDRKLALQAVASFPGLEHRCEFVIERNGVTWWNDSKGTNVASTITAIHSLTEIVVGKLIMILGGQGKGQDFSSLVNTLQGKTRAVILLGENKQALKNIFSTGENVIVVETLAQAVEIANQCVQSGDAVLLSPACASQDMFVNYEERGNQFKALVLEIKNK